MADKANFTGFIHQKGDVDGFQYDNLYITQVARLRPSDMQRGYAGIQIKCDTALKEKLMKIEFNSPHGVPLEFEMEKFAKPKGGFEEMIVSINPLPISKVAG